MHYWPAPKDSKLRHSTDKRVGVAMSTFSNYSIAKLTTSSPFLPIFKSPSSSCSSLSVFSTTSLFLPSSSSSSQLNKVNHILRVSSSAGEANEVEEESKFVSLNDEDPSFGPPAVLLLGFGVEELDKIKQLLKELEGEFLEVIYCTEDMITRPLWDAVNTKQQSLEKLKIAKSVPRLCFLSGLTGEEMMMFIDAFQDSDIEPAVFAAVVPNSSGKPLEEVIEEVMGDHESVMEDSDKL